MSASATQRPLCAVQQVGSGLHAVFARSGLSLQTLIVASRTRPSRAMAAAVASAAAAKRAICCCDGSRRVASACERGRYTFVRRRQGIRSARARRRSFRDMPPPCRPFRCRALSRAYRTQRSLYFDLKDPFFGKDVLWRIPRTGTQKALRITSIIMIIFGFWLRFPGAIIIASGAAADSLGLNDAVNFQGTEDDGGHPSTMAVGILVPDHAKPTADRCLPWPARFQRCEQGRPLSRAQLGHLHHHPGDDRLQLVLGRHIPGRPFRHLSAASSTCWCAPPSPTW